MFVFVDAQHYYYGHAELTPSPQTTFACDVALFQCKPEKTDAGCCCLLLHLFQPEQEVFEGLSETKLKYFLLMENITRSRSRPTCKRQSEEIFFAPCGKVSVCHHLGRPLPSLWLRTWAIKKYHCYHALTLSLSAPEILSVTFSLLQSFPIAFDVLIWKCWVRYKSRQSVYRLSPYH